MFQHGPIVINFNRPYNRHDFILMIVLFLEKFLTPKGIPFRDILWLLRGLFLILLLLNFLLHFIVLCMLLTHLLPLIHFTLDAPHHHLIILQHFEPIPKHFGQHLQLKFLLLFIFIVSRLVILFLRIMQQLPVLLVLDLRQVGLLVLIEVNRSAQQPFQRHFLKVGCVETSFLCNQGLEPTLLD